MRMNLRQVFLKKRELSAPGAQFALMKLSKYQPVVMFSPQPRGQPTPESHALSSTGKIEDALGSDDNRDLLSPTDEIYLYMYSATLDVRK